MFASEVSNEIPSFFVPDLSIEEKNLSVKVTSIEEKCAYLDRLIVASTDEEMGTERDAPNQVGVHHFSRNHTASPTCALEAFSRRLRADGSSARFT